MPVNDNLLSRSYFLIPLIINFNLILKLLGIGHDLTNKLCLMQSGNIGILFMTIRHSFIKIIVMHYRHKYIRLKGAYNFRPTLIISVSFHKINLFYR